MINAAIKESAEIVLRKHLHRCFDDIVKSFPELVDTPKEEAVEQILTLRREGKIIVSLASTANGLITTRINWVS